jgi:hypothetical protein
LLAQLAVVRVLSDGGGGEGAAKYMHYIYITKYVSRNIPEDSAFVL